MHIKGVVRDAYAFISAPLIIFSDEGVMFVEW